MKIGKTEFCSLVDGALILAFEQGTHALTGVHVQPIDTWSTFKVVIRQLAREDIQKKFKVICIDTVDIAYDLCEKYVCDANHVDSVSEIPYGGGYKLVGDEFKKAFRDITFMPYGIIFTSHLKEKTDTKTGEVIERMPELGTRCGKIVNGMCDIIGVLTRTWDENGKPHRWIQLQATQDTMAGSRYKYLPEKIPFGYKELVNAINHAIDVMETEGATVTDTLDKNVNQTYESLMDEARMIWSRLVELNKTEDAMNRIETIMGVRMKLSEFTPDKNALLSIVLEELRQLI